MRMFKSRSKGTGQSLFCIIESFGDSETSLTTSQAVMKVFQH